jgi:hypothetical protein
MFDLYAIESSQLHVEMINRMAAESRLLSHNLLRVPRVPRLSLHQRLLDGLGSLLIETGIRLKTRALTKAETASSPTWLITL